MSERLEYVVKRRTPTSVGDCTRQHQRQITQVCRRFLKLGKATHAHDGGDRAMPPRHHQIRAPLGIGDETRHASLRGFSDTYLMRVMQHGHIKTIQ